MADADAALKAKLVKLVGALREQQAKGYELVEEIDRLLGGGVGIGARMKQVNITWMAAWSARYHGDYMFVPTKDAPQLKRLLKTLSPEELQARMCLYMSDGDPYLVKARHPFALFVAHVNRYASETPASFNLEAPVSGCKHQPPCGSDQEHTKKRAAEMRA